MKQILSIREANLAAFEERWTRAIIDCEWQLSENTKIQLTIEAFEEFLTMPISKVNQLMFKCLNFIKIANPDFKDWEVIDDDAKNICIYRLDGIKNTYPKNVVALKLKVYGKTNIDEILLKLSE